MKTSRISAIALLVVLGSALAFANGIDPQVIIHGVGNGGSAPVTCSPSKCIDVGLRFNFVIPSGGSSTLYFTNKSGVAWTSLALIEVCKHGACAVPAVDIKCHSYLFGSCTAETLKNGNLEILLAGTHGPLNLDKGIGINQSFSMTFSCVGKDCSPGGLSFRGDANGFSVPEPGTMALMITGLGALLLRRKIWKKRWNS